MMSCLELFIPILKEFKVNKKKHKNLSSLSLTPTRLRPEFCYNEMNI